MASLAQVCAALAETVRTGIQSEMFCYADVPGGPPALPACIVEPGPADFNVAMQRGSDCWEFHLFILVQIGDFELAQQQLKRFVDGGGPDSIRKAIFDNSTLGGVVDDATVYAMVGYGGRYEAARVDHIGAALRVRVVTDGREV